MKRVVFLLNFLVVSLLLSVSLVGCTITVAPANSPSHSKPAPSTPATDAKSTQNRNDNSSSNLSSSTSNQNNNSSSSMKISSSHQKRILLTKELAREGRVLNTEFQVEKNTIDQVEAKYGIGKRGEAAEPWNGYVTYSSRNLSFGVNKGDQIYDVRSYDPTLQELRLWEVKKVLGKPDDIKSYQKQAIYIYQVTKEIQLKWIFNYSDQKAKVDHISVVNPQLSKNFMAK